MVLSKQFCNNTSNPKNSAMSNLGVGKDQQGSHKKTNPTKLEFLMMVNDNIIVQRFFNVKDFNPKAKTSIKTLPFLS